MSDGRADRVGIAEAKRDFADLLGAVRHRGARFIIERRGTPVAALVPLDDLARLEQPRVEDGGVTGFLALVGAFDDGQELPDLLDRAVRDRPAQRARAAPDLDVARERRGDAPTPAAP